MEMHPVPAQHPREVMQTIPWKYQALPGKELLLHFQMAKGEVHPELYLTLSAHFSGPFFSSWERMECNSSTGNHFSLT